MLTIEQREIVFNLNEIQSGDFIWAKHYSWNKGKRGLVADISADMMKVQFVPDRGHVSNYFYIHSNEVEDSWQIRWSHDLKTVHNTEAGDD